MPLGSPRGFLGGKMPGNDNVHASKAEKADEFYTKLSFIEDELKHYKNYLRGKTVFCNCDDPYESNFFKFFAMSFNDLGLKKLIATCFSPSPVAYQQLSLFDEEENEPKKAYKVEITEIKDENGDGRIDLEDVEYILQHKEGVLSELKGNGDFRSNECIELLKEADVIITNPPFSIFREYFSLLMKYKKDFLIVANENMVFYKEILPYFKQNKVWLGYNAGHFWFKVPEYYEEKKTDFKIDENGQKWRRLGNICWFTNIDIAKRYENLILYKHYNPEDYPTYENYNAIHIHLVRDIPCDFDGIMGVPVSFMEKFNANQFEIVGHTNSGDNSPEVEAIRTDNNHRHGGLLNGKEQYARLLIRRK